MTGWIPEVVARGGTAGWTSTPYADAHVRFDVERATRDGYALESGGAPCAGLAYLVAGTSTSVWLVAPSNNTMAARILLVLEVTEQ
jgi:hypothetical protein